MSDNYNKKYIVKGNKTIISFDGEPIVAADSVSLEITRNTEEVSNLDSGDWKEFEGTLFEFSGSLEGKMYVAESGTTSGYTYNRIMEDFLAGNGEYTITTELGAEYNNKVMDGNVIITKVPFENNREGVNTYSVEFQGTGNVTMNDVTT
jgi:predicted secreted protein